MFWLARGDEAKGDMSAEARNAWPLPAARDEGGRSEEWDASGVLFRLPMMLLADMASAAVRVATADGPVRMCRRLAGLVMFDAPAGLETKGYICSVHYGCV